MTQRYQTPEQGTVDWHIPLNENFKKLEKQVEIRDDEANLKDYDPAANRLFRATDTGNIYLGTGSSWERHNPPGGSNAGSDWVSITDFGAIGDGASDDSSALEDALEAETKVFLPERTFSIQEPLSFSGLQDVHIHGPGTIKFDYPDASYEHLLEFSNARHIRITGVNFDGNYGLSGEYGALRFDDCEDITIRECDLRGFGNVDAETHEEGLSDHSHTIATRGCIDVDVLHNRLKDTGGKGVSVYAKPSSNASESARLIGNRTYNTGEEGLFVGTENDKGDASAIIAHNDIDTTRIQYGIRVGGDQSCHALITGNTLRNTQNAAIEVKTLAPSVYTITNNVTYGNNGINMRATDEPLGGVIANNTLVNSGDYQGIKVLSGCENVIISGNYTSMVRINSGNNFSVYGNYTYGRGIDTRGASNIQAGFNI